MQYGPQIPSILRSDPNIEIVHNVIITVRMPLVKDFFPSGVAAMSSNMPKNIPKVIDLFSGAGGLSLGAARAGFEICGAVDSDPGALGVHAKNFPGTLHSNGDVSELTGHSLRRLFGLPSETVTGIMGGPPCQGFSNMGRRDLYDTRNRLFTHFFRVVNEARPAFFLAENVLGILQKQYAEMVESSLAQVSRDYVVLDPIKICAADYGAPTSRTRVFFFGYLPDLMGKLTAGSFGAPCDVKPVLVRDALDGLPVRVDPKWQKEEDGWRKSESRGTGYFAVRLQGCVPSGVGDAAALKRLANEGLSSGTLGTRHSSEVAKRYAALKHGERDRVSKAQRLDPDGFCPTLRAGTGPDRGSYQAVRPIHPVAHRVITPREGARLQGFPDWFTFSPSKWHSFRQIGNSVSPIVAERILNVIWASLH